MHYERLQKELSACRKHFIHTNRYKVPSEIEGIHNLVPAEGNLLILIDKVPIGRECTLSVFYTDIF